MTSAHAITLENVSKHYGAVKAIDDVSLAVAPGEFITLLGPSGSGKTTVLMAIAGFVTPTRGTIRLDGTPITEKPPESRNFGVVFQGYALFPHMSVADNVAYPLRVRRTAKAEMGTRVKAALDLVQLGPLADRMPPQLSGGQQQRVALARALVFQPQVLLLDEPMSALDKKLRAELQLELRDLHRRLGATFINVTHDQEEAIIMSDRIAIMRDGKVIQLGAPKELYERPATRFVADFLGKSNFLSGKVTAVEAGIATLAMAGATIRHRTTGAGLTPGSSVTLALRPHKAGLANGRLPDGMNAIRCAVVSAVYVGTYAQLLVRTPAGDALTLTLPTSNEALPEEGAEATVIWSPDATVQVRED
jgi:putative spermidine/putrescine transport system ATP-binding protein